jgi:hypothetical protein
MKGMSYDFPSSALCLVVLEGCLMICGSSMSWGWLQGGLLCCLKHDTTQKWI